MPVRKSRGWMFTFYPEILWSKMMLTQYLQAIELIECDYMIMQKEQCPTTSRIHIQGFVYFGTPRTMKGTKKRFHPGTHLEPNIKSIATCAEYCAKIESRVLGDSGYAFQKGAQPKQGSRGDINEVMAFAKVHTELECWTEFPIEMTRYHIAIRRFQALSRPRQSTMPVVTVIYGRTGTGKSFLCEVGASNGDKTIGPGTRPFYIMPTPVSKSAIPWLDGYEGQEDVIIEDFDGTIYYRILLRMLDRYGNTMQVKGGFTEFAPKRIWISSNIHPKEWYPNDEAADTWGTGPLHRRLTSNGSRILHLIKPFEGPGKRAAIKLSLQLAK